MPPVKELVIKRSQWGMGALLTKEDKMCCLGFLSIACGIPKSSLRSNGPILYRMVSWDINPQFKPKWKADGLNKMPWSQATNINDDKFISSSDKEEQLIKLFAENGITLTFED